MIRTLLPWLGLALAGIGGAAHAQGTAFAFAGCRVHLLGQWQIAGDRATGPRDGSVQLLGARNTETVIDMARDSDFVLVEQTAAWMLFRRVMPTGELHFRSMTKTNPPCVADIVVRAADSVAGMTIARSIAVAPAR